MKVAFFLEADSKNPGGYNQTLSTVTFINEKNKHNEDIIYVANSENLKNKLTEKGINSLLYKRTFFDKLIYPLQHLLIRLLFFFFYFHR